MDYKNDYRKPLYSVYANDFETFTENTTYYKRTQLSGVYCVSSKKVDITKKANTLTYQEVVYNNNKAYKYNPRIYINIKDWLEYQRLQEREQLHYFHNFTKFDFFFLQSWLLYDSNYRDCTDEEVKQLLDTVPCDFYTITNSGSTFRVINIYLYNRKTGKHTHLDVRDSIKLINGSIEKISVQLKKLGYEIDDKVLDFNPDTIQEPLKSVEELKSNYRVVYNRVYNDATILATAIKVYFTRDGFLTKGSDIKHTIPSLALSKYASLLVEEKQLKKDEKKHPYLKEWEVEDDNLRNSVNNYFLVDNDFYYGGVTSFNAKDKNNWILNQTITSYDINSMYPAQMIKELPVGYGSIEKTLPKNKKDKFIFYRLQGTYMLQQCSRYPAVINHKWCKKQIDSKEHFSYNVHFNFLDFCVSEEEALLYLNKDYFKSDLQVCEYYVFDKKPVFKNYIDKYYSLKENATNALDKIIAKLHLNSLYGKTCEKPQHTNYIPKQIYRDNYFSNFKAEYNPILKPCDESYFYERIETINYSHHTYAPLGCAITSLARAFLINSFITLTKNDNDLVIYYCDTDSMKTNKTLENISPELIDSKKLGLWKNEGSVKYFKVIRAKVYCGCNDLTKFTEDDWVVTSGLSPSEIKKRYTPLEFEEDLCLDVLNVSYDFHHQVILRNGVKYINKLC